MKKIMPYLAPFFIIHCSYSSPQKQPPLLKNSTPTKTVVLVIAYNDYQPTEYATTKEILSNADYAVKTASTQPGKATATDKSNTTVDLTIDALDPNDYDGLFVIGGRGTLKYLNTPTMHSLLQQFATVHKPFGAICLGSRVLAHAGVLKGKNATGWDGDNELTTIFKEYNIHYVPDDVVVDGSTVTATGPEAARAFGEAIVQTLKNQ